ncbi:MAG: hypothetical protein IT210_17645 [Armatimonadetes bacterium]|nr:hypothetical protein [Armatimonadota bacterium]
MKKWLLVFYFALACASAFTAPKVAVVYSAWGGNAFKEEFDSHLKALGWPLEALENKDIARWIGRLDEFDIVISASVGNLENPQDMAPYRDAWLNFLKRGGALMIVDASYDPALGLWMGRLGSDFALTSAGCAPYTRKVGGSGAISADPNHPLLHVPQEIPPLLRAKGNIWAHLESRGKGWESLVTCADGKDLMVYRTVGRGAVLVTSYYSFKGPMWEPLATGLLENLRTYTLGLRSGVSVSEFRPGPAAPGSHRAVLTFRNASDQPVAYRASLKLAWGSGRPRAAAQSSITLQPGRTARLALPYTIQKRGSLLLILELAGKGSDRISLERMQEVPSMVSLDIRNRHLYPADRSLQVATAFSPDAGVRLADCTARLLIGEKPFLTLRSPKPAGRYRIDISRLPSGSHRARLEMALRGKVLGSASADFSRHPQPRVAIRPDGAIQIGGKPFFPFGWYHVSWSFTAEERMAFLQDVAAGGFNTVHAGVKLLEEWEPFLKEAGRLGVYVVTEFGTDPIPVIRRYKNMPSVMAWNPGDEPDGQGISPEEMLARYNRFKTADPSHPTYMVLCVPNTYARYAHCAEIIAPDIYPIPSSPTSAVYMNLRAASAEARKYGRPVWGVLQCFGYPQGPWRVPTFEECRNMTYLALLAGVKGIVYYTYADNGFKITDHPRLWADMRTLPQEIQALAPYLLTGRLASIETSRPDVFAGAWTLNGKTVVCVVNTSDKESRPVRLKAPGQAVRSIQPLFPNRLSGLSAQEGRIAGTVGPLEVHLYEVQSL